MTTVLVTGGAGYLGSHCCKALGQAGYASGLKTWMRRFRGVATKYLESYLGWRRMIDREGDRLTAHLCIAVAHAPIARST